jgi:predicted nucleic acid-binding protein
MVHSRIEQEPGFDEHMVRRDERMTCFQDDVRYGEVLAELKKRGQSIPTMDLLIATAALTHDATRVTSNARDLDRVPGLTVRGY